MLELIPGDSIVDYLSLCFGINAALAFNRIQEFFRRQAKFAQAKKAATLTIIAKELNDSDKNLCSAAQTTLNYLKTADSQFSDGLKKSYLRGRYYSFMGCLICFIGIVFSAYPEIKDGHLLNLLYLFPVPLFIADIFLAWLIWRLGLYRSTKKWHSYIKHKLKIQQLECEIKKDIPHISPSTQDVEEIPFSDFTL